MKIFLDTNILVDLCLDRQPHSLCAQQVLEAVEAGAIEAHIAAISLTNLYYLLNDLNKKKDTRSDIATLCALLEVAPTDKAILEAALANGFKDFEDGIQYESALACSAQYLISRNKKDFKKSRIPVLDACEFAAQLRSAAMRKSP